GGWFADPPSVTIPGSRREGAPMPHRFCRGPLSRRALLRLGALALGGLHWPRLVQAQSTEPPPSTSVILFWMWGGPSQFTTFGPHAGPPRRVPGAVPPHPHGRPRNGRLRAVPAPGAAGPAPRPDPVAAPHDVVAQRRVHRGADRQDPGRGRPDLDGALRPPRLRHGRQPGARPAGRRPAPLRRHPDGAVHDPADLPGPAAPGVRRGRPVRPRLRPAGPRAGGGPHGRTIRPPPPAARAVRPAPPRGGRGRPAGGDRPAARGRPATAFQPASRRGVRPGPRRPAAAGRLRPAPVGPELP